MGEDPFALFLGVADFKFQPVRAQPTSIADLAAGFGVEGRVMQHHQALVAGVQFLVLGVMGEYVGRAFMSANGKPQGVVREIIPARDDA